MEESLNFGIKSQFLNIKKFNTITQKAKRGQIIYDNYCQSLEKYYFSYQSIYDNLYQKIKINPHDKSSFVKEFKKFLQQLSTTIKQISVFQIDCLTQIRSIKDQSLNQTAQALIDKANNYRQPQNQFLKKYDNFIKLSEQISNQFIQLKKEIKDPTIYYNPKVINSKKKIMTDLIQQITKLNNELTQQLKEITHNSTDFQKYLIAYRKKLFLIKYYYLNKLIQMSKCSQECLTEMIILLYQCTVKRFQAFKKQIKNGANQLMLKSAKLKRNSKLIQGVQDDSIASQIIILTQQYNAIIDQLNDILQTLIASLIKMAESGRIQYEKCKKTFLDNLNKLYQIEESPSSKVMDSLDLFNYFTQKIAGMADKLTFCSQNLSKLKQNVKKHTDITLSLLKCGPYKTKTVKAQIDQSPRYKSNYDALHQQMSQQFINNIIQHVYKIFYETLTQIKHYFNSRYYKKKKNNVQDSMELSHIQSSIIQQFSKKPSQNEICLWGDVKDRSYNIFYPKDQIEDINKFLKNLLLDSNTQNNNKQLDKYPCTIFAKKDNKGILKIYQKQILFNSSDGSVHIKVPIIDIQEVLIKVKLFDKILSVNTSAGELVFGKFVDINQPYEFLLKHLEDGGNTASATIKPKRVSVLLSQQQVNLIKTRRQKIVNSLEKIDGLTKIIQITIPNVTIDHLYQLAYSDKPVNVRGKQEDNLMVYIAKKAKNSNVISTIYNPPGPKFYTGNQSVNFENCPMFSQRKLQYDHPIPPMPFMPKFCHVIESLKLYWISNQEFQYLGDSQSYGAPYADAFYARVIHKIKKTQQGINIIVYAGTIFVKSISFQSMIQSKAQQQMTIGIKNTVEEIRKFIKLSLDETVKQQGQKQTIEQKQEIQTKVQDNNHNEIGKLKFQNKILIAGFILLIVVNIISKLIFSGE